MLILLVVAAGIGGFYYRKRRNEERLVRKLVTISFDRLVRGSGEG